MLTRDQFFSAVVPKVKSVDVPALGDSVFVRAMTAGERDAFEVAHTKSHERDFRARLAAATVCDDAGTLLFGPGDIQSLSAVPAFVLEPLVQAAVEINSLSSQAIEDLRKN